LEEKAPHHLPGLRMWGLRVDVHLAVELNHDLPIAGGLADRHLANTHDLAVQEAGPG
jgi:hypothetical protein